MQRNQSVFFFTIITLYLPKNKAPTEVSELLSFNHEERLGNSKM